MRKWSLPCLLFPLTMVITTATLLFQQLSQDTKIPAFGDSRGRERRELPPDEALPGSSNIELQDDAFLNSPISDEVADEFEEIVFRVDKSQLETISIPFSSIASLANPAKDMKDKGLMKTIEHGANFVNSLSAELARTQDNVNFGKATSQMNRRTLIDGLGFLMGSFEKLDGISFFEKLQEATIRFYSVPRNSDEIQAFSVRTQEALVTFSEYQHFFTDPQSVGYQSNRGRTRRERRELPYDGDLVEEDLFSSNTAQYISDGTHAASTKIEQRKNEKLQLETIIIPFSNIASIGKPANAMKDEGLLKTIKNGANFVSSLRTNLARTEGNSEIEKATAQMNRRTLIDGLGFFMGSFEKLDSISFYQKVQEETIRFYSVPRNPDEIQAFSVRTQEAIQTFSEYQHFFTTPQPAVHQSTQGVNTRAETDGLVPLKSVQVDNIPEERRLIQYLTTKEPLLVSGPLGLEDKIYSRRLEDKDKSLNSHFQRIYRPHRIEKENDELTTDDREVSRQVSAEENERTARHRHLFSPRQPGELGLTEKLSVAGVEEVNGSGSNRIDILIEEEVMKDLEMKEDIIDTFLNRILADFGSAVVETDYQVESEDVSKAKEFLVQEKKLEHVFPDVKMKEAGSNSYERNQVEAFIQDVGNKEIVNGYHEEKDVSEIAFGHKLRHALLNKKSVILMMEDGLDPVAASPEDRFGGDTSDHEIDQEDSVKKIRKLSTHRSGVPMIGKMLIVKAEAKPGELENEAVEVNPKVFKESSQEEEKYLDVFIDNLLASLNLPSDEISVSDETYKLMVDSESKTLEEFGPHKEVMMIPSSMLNKSVVKEMSNKDGVKSSQEYRPLDAGRKTNSLRFSTTPIPETRSFPAYLSPSTDSSTPSTPHSLQKISRVNKSEMLVKVYEEESFRSFHLSDSVDPTEVGNKLDQDQPLANASRGFVLKVTSLHEDVDEHKDDPIVLDNGSSTTDSMEDFLDRLLNQINFESQKEVPEESQVFLKVKEVNSRVEHQVSKSQNFEAQDDSVEMSLDKLVVVDTERALSGKRRVESFHKYSSDSGTEQLLPSLGTGLKTVMVMIKKDRNKSRLNKTLLEKPEEDDTKDEDDNRLDLLMNDILDTYEFYTEVSVSDEKYAKMVDPLPAETTGATVHLRSRTAFPGAEVEPSREKPLNSSGRRHFSSMEVLMVPTPVFQTITREGRRKGKSGIGNFGNTSEATNTESSSFRHSVLQNIITRKPLSEIRASYLNTTISSVETTKSVISTTESSVETTEMFPGTAVSYIKSTTTFPDTLRSVGTSESVPNTTSSVETTETVSETTNFSEPTSSLAERTVSSAETTESFPDTTLSPIETTESVPDTTLSLTETTASFPDTTWPPTETTESFPDTTLFPTETTESFPDTKMSPTETLASFYEKKSSSRTVTVSISPQIILTTVSPSEIRTQDEAREYQSHVRVHDGTMISTSETTKFKATNVETRSKPAKPRMSFVRHFSGSGFQFTRKPKLQKNQPSSVTISKSASTTDVGMSTAGSLDVSTLPSAHSRSSTRLTTENEFALSTTSTPFRSKTIETTEYSSMSVTTMASEVTQSSSSSATLTTSTSSTSMVDESTTISSMFKTSEYSSSISNVVNEVSQTSSTLSIDVTSTSIKEFNIFETESTSTLATVDTTSNEIEEEHEQVEQLTTEALNPQPSNVEFSFIELLQPVKQEASSPVTAKSLIFTPITAVPLSLEISPFLSTTAVESIPLAKSASKIDQPPIFTQIPAVPLPSPELSFKPIVAVPTTSSTVSPAVASSSSTTSKLPSGESTADVLALSLKLLKKLTMLAASDVDAEELPELLNSVYKSETVPPPTRTSFTFPTSTTNPKPVLRKKNFKHKKFASFYKKLNDKDSEEETKDEEVEGGKVGLLASLRSQITANALKDKKLKAKANNIPIYRPRKKLNRKNVKNFYKERKMNKKEEAVATVKKDSLKSELQETLKAQLARLKSDIQTKQTNEKVVKQKLEVELADSLRSQLARVLPSLAPTTPRPLDLMLDRMDDEQLRQSLEDQLRALYNT